MRSSGPALGILVIILLVAALIATGYFIGRTYVDRRSNRRNWR
jgi:Ni,Fe-hydrogenase I cytochrome b subunit